MDPKFGLGGGGEAFKTDRTPEQMLDTGHSVQPPPLINESSSSSST